VSVEVAAEATYAVFVQAETAEEKCTFSQIPFCLFTANLILCSIIGSIAVKNAVKTF
jgi:hypothetical protein